jgi:hypothetical protein
VRRGAASCRAVRGSCQWRRSGPKHRCRHRWAVLGGRAPPGAVTRVRSGRPAGVAGAGRSGRWTGWSLPCPRPGPAVGRPSSPSSGRPTSGVRCPGVRCPGVRTDRLRCPRHCRRAVRVALDLEWLGVGAARLGAVDRGPRCPRAGGRLPASGLTRRRWYGGWPCPAATRSTVARGRGLAGVPAAAPPGRHGLVQGQGAGRVGEPGTQQVLTGPPAGRPGGRRRGARPWGVDPAAVTTLGGRSARVVRWRPAPEGPPGSVGSSLRPQRGRDI